MTAQNHSADILKKQISLAGLEPEMIVNTLSGGMKRRVAILRALLAPFDILILDEPFKGLDADTKLTMMNMVKEKVSKKTMILITHDPSETLFFNSRIIDFSSFDNK
jgi:NitT/TauT family transport system ATP-binding protein